ncbi:hypothetical protein MKZ38_005150 [Zalerion maritima]|uniref:Uncharacterized protein n=1 Tax=Zalerion maritima TaxID=339359 RepID=A0AAD5WQG4_9PEZI|nr:hypothetical protein MKZ38_005150 [Zalerion maritima]
MNSLLQDSNAPEVRVDPPKPAQRGPMSEAASTVQSTFESDGTTLTGSSGKPRDLCHSSLEACSPPLSMPTVSGVPPPSTWKRDDLIPPSSHLSLSHLSLLGDEASNNRPRDAGGQTLSDFLNSRKSHHVGPWNPTRVLAKALGTQPEHSERLLGVLPAAPKTGRSALSDASTFTLCPDVPHSLSDDNLKMVPNADLHSKPRDTAPQRWFDELFDSCDVETTQYGVHQGCLPDNEVSRSEVKGDGNQAVKTSSPSPKSTAEPKLQMGDKPPSLVTQHTILANPPLSRPGYPRFRQVAVAKIYVELQHWLPRPNTSVFQDDGASSTSSVESDVEMKDCPCNKEKNSQTSDNPQQSSVAETSSALDPRPPTTSLSSGSGGISNKGGDGCGRKRRRARKYCPLGPEKIQFRYACPYQAYLSIRGCFPISAKRNPLGGCDSIPRIKHHLRRCHSISHRCQRCWISFDTTDQASQHQSREQCEILDQPEYEIFMSSDQEETVRQRTPKFASDLDVWWQLFGLLLPELEGSDVYNRQNWPLLPYYDPYGGLLAIPPITVNASQSLAPNLHSTGGDGTGNSDSQSFHLPSILMAPDIPMYQQLPEHPSPTGAESRATSNSNSSGSSNIITPPPVTAQENTTPFASTPSPFVTRDSMPPPPPQSHETRQQQALERARKRAIDAEDEAFRRRNAQNGAAGDISDILKMQDDILASQDMPDEAHEAFSRLYDRLKDVKDNLLNWNKYDLGEIK